MIYVRFTFLLLPKYEGSLRYYADADGLRVDAIELTDGRWAADNQDRESKVEGATAANLIEREKGGLLILAARNLKPSFMAIAAR